MSRLSWTLLLVFVTAIWGWTFVVVKQAIAQYGVVPFLLLRFSIAVVAMSAFLRPANFSRRGLLTGGVIGLVLATVYLFQTFGLSYTTPTLSGLVTGLFVVFAPLLNRVLFGVRVGAWQWLAVLFSFAGLALLAGATPDSISLGEWLTLGAAVCLGLHICLLDRYGQDADAVVLALGQFLGATSVFGLTTVFTGGLVWPSPTVIMALLVTGLLATAVGFYTQTLVQQRLSAVRVAVILCLEPVFSTLFGYLAGDRLTGRQWLGAGLTLGAVALAEIAPRLASRRRLRLWGRRRGPAGAGPGASRD